MLPGSRPLTLREEAEMLVRYSSLQRRRFCRCFIDMTRAGQGVARVVAELGGAGCRPTTRSASSRVLLLCQFAEEGTRRQLLVSAHRACSQVAQAEPHIRRAVTVQV